MAFSAIIKPENRCVIHHGSREPHHINIYHTNGQYIDTMTLNLGTVARLLCKYNKSEKNAKQYAKQPFGKIPKLYGRV